MERVHPNKRRTVFALRAALILALAGCSNQQMSASNPFMSPDRVPPPATRTIAPGTAAPYYPGDPIPSAQNAPPGMLTPPMVAQAPPGARPPIVPTAAAPIAASPTQVMPQAVAPQPLAFSNERTVAIPTDSQDLRFALPSPPTQPPAAPMAAAAPVQPTQQVIPAAFNQPVAMQPTPAAGLVPTATTDTNTSGPWRAPQVPNNGSPVMQAQYVQPQQLQPQSMQPTMLAAQPQTAPQAASMSPNAMPVQLRAVAAPTTSPTMAPTAPTMVPVAPAGTMDPALNPPPRMRFPSWTEPSTWFTPQPATTGPPPGQQLVGYMVPGPNGTQQMVSVEQYQAMTGGAPQGAPAVATSDGFRPRGTTSK